MDKLKKVLLIDDDNINNFIVINKLNSLGLVDKIVSAENGQEAIDYILTCIIENENLPELVFLDINMPIMDGWGFLDVFEKIEKIHQHKITIYMVSSSVYKEDIEKSNNYSSVKMFISKPLTKEKLSELIQLRMTNS